MEFGYLPISGRFQFAAPVDRFVLKISPLLPHIARNLLRELRPERGDHLGLAQENDLNLCLEVSSMG
jgi:hypothetical protein